MAILRKPIARVLVRPPERPSSGAQTINEKLGQLSRLSRKSPVPKQYRIVINWGNSSSLSIDNGVKVLNAPTAIGMASNKLVAFRRLKDSGVRVPEFTTEPPKHSDAIYLARTTVRGSGGEGIIVVRPGEAFPPAPLYVKYVQKTLEYRVHVAGGRAIFGQLKKRKSDYDQDKDQKLIRNYDNGWVFCPVPAEEIAQVIKDEAVKAVAAMNLDFGAVDLVISKKDNLPYILEINTAPGLESPGLISAYEVYFRSQVA